LPIEPLHRQTVRKVSISEFKAKCCALVEYVHRTRRSLPITRRGVPVAIWFSHAATTSQNLCWVT
jgi:PHD/YefM family antitoxin component YafN of YafNO toxin-antitoxin module